MCPVCPAAIHAFTGKSYLFQLNEIYAEFNWPIPGAPKLLCHVSIKKSCL